MDDSRNSGADSGTGTGTGGGTSTDAGGMLLAGRYRLGTAIGSGGMGKVWHAQDETLGRVVAVKELTAVLYASDADRARLTARTQKEARAAARISHPCVVTVHDVLEYDDRPWIVMELIDGPSLADRVREEGRIGPHEAAGIGRQVLAALRAAHAAGVVHRDVKPANVLLARDGRVLLTDFGIATVEGDNTITRTGELVGSVDFLAPERVRGSSPGPAADLWSLGATLYCAVEGSSPFRRTTALGTLQAVVTEETEPMRYAGVLGPVIGALLRKEPGDRPSAEETDRLLVEAEQGRLPRPAGAMADTTATVVQGTVQAPFPSPGQASLPSAAGGPPVTPFRTTGRPPAPEHAATAYSRLPEQPRRRRDRRRTWLVVVLAGALLGGAVTFGAVKYGDRLFGGGTVTVTVTDKDRSADPSGTGLTDSTGSTDDTEGRPSAVPEGWGRADDRAGFSLLVPDGWIRQTDGDEIDYTPDNGTHRIRVGVARTPEHPTVYAHFTAIEPAVAKSSGYERVQMHSNAFRGQPGALWEFTWKDSSGNGWRAIDQGYIAADGTEYLIYMSSPETEWATTRQQFETVLDSWTLTDE